MHCGKTHPGFVLKSASYELKFISGHQLGLGARAVEREANWRGVMKIILDIFEEFFF